MHRTATSNLQVAFVTWALFGISEIGNMIEDCPIWCCFVDGSFLPFASLVQGPFPKDNWADSNLWGHFVLDVFARNRNGWFQFFWSQMPRQFTTMLVELWEHTNGNKKFHYETYIYVYIFQIFIFVFNITCPWLWYLVLPPLPLWFGGGVGEWVFYK